VLAQYAPTWLVQMSALVSTAELEVLQRKVAGATRERMLREMAEAVEALTAEWGLVLVFEDLQWSDHSTLELIAYLARRREPARLMIVGTYRPTDVVVRAHPLKGIKQELQVHGQCEEIRLELLTEEDVAEYVARRFGGEAQESVPELARLVSRRTDGNALFMVNLVNDLLSRQVIIRRGERWELRGTIADIEREVPSSIRQFIEQQIDRLSPADQHMLEVASVAGAEFSAATVAAGIAATVTAVEERCETLGRHGQFLQARGSEEWPDGTVTACYRFLHALYQDVLYERIPAGQKVELHRRIGERREHAYGDRAHELAAGLAMHFERGREYHRAVYYLGKAGENAVRRSAHQEAIRYLTKGLELLQVLPETPERVQQELSLHLTLGLPLAATRGYAVPEIERTYARAYALCQQIGETPLLFPALVGLWAFYLVRGRLQMAREIAIQGLLLAEQAQNPAFLLEAHLGLGLISCFLGELHSARAHLEEGITVARTLDRTDRFPTFFQDSEVGCLTYGASVLWHLGYPDQARTRMNEAVTLARKLAHPFSEAYALNLGAGLQMLCRDLPTFRQWITEALTLAQTQGFPLWVGLGTAVSGWALIEQGQIGEGMTQVHQGLALYQATGTELSKSFFLLLLAEAYGRTGQTAEGLALLAETQAFVDITGERLYEAELYRLKGELLLQSQASPRQVKASRDKSKVTNL
jgi:predicted ATPase